MTIAQVTIELRDLLKNDYFELFDFPYEFDDKQMAQKLEQSVIDHFFFYEIGQETPDRFKHVFRTAWLSAIGYYNELHNTTLLKYNPLINYTMSEALEQLRQTENTEDLTASNQLDRESMTTDSEDSEQNKTGNTTEEVESTSKRTDDLGQTSTNNEQFSDYPNQPIGTSDYLSGARITEEESINTGTVDNEGESTSITTNTEQNTSNTEGQSKTTNQESGSNTQNRQSTGTDNTNYQKTIEGLTGKTYQELIQLERSNIIRITAMLIEELKPCFILVY